MSTWGRRDMMRGLGLGAAALGLGLGRTAFGQTDPIPKRVIFFYGGSGSRPGLWEPRGGATDWTLNDLHQPLSAHRDRLTYVQNLHMLSAETDPTPPANAHIDGGTHAMVAAHRLSSDRAGAMSIDQRIVRALEAGGAATALPSLEVQAAAWPHTEGLPVYSGPGEQLPFLWDPREVYSRLFPDGRPDPSMMDQRPEQRSRVLDFALQRFGRLDDPRLGAAARGKLQDHAAELRSIQTRLALGRGRAFNIPEPSVLSSVPDFDYNTSPETKAGYWRTTTDINSQLVVAALHADVTRVVTFYVHDAPGPLCFYSGGRYFHDNDFGVPSIHELTHQVNNRYTPLEDPDAQEVIRQQHLQTSGVFGQLLDRLAAAVEPDGSSLMDHTLVVWVSQIADGSHALTDLPWLVAGDCQGAVNTGQWLQSGERRGHGQFYRTVARALDVDIPDFGADPPGLIPGLLAT